MKRSELKSLIKECIKESIFEEGILSGIITEVATGMSGLPSNAAPRQSQQTAELSKKSAEAAALLENTRKSVISAITESSYDDIKSKFQNPDFFEGTTPIVEGSGPGPLSNTPPGDPGLAIENIPGFGSWGNVANAKTRK